MDGNAHQTDLGEGRNMNFEPKPCERLDPRYDSAGNLVGWWANYVGVISLPVDLLGDWTSDVGEHERNRFVRPTMAQVGIARQCHNQTLGRIKRNRH